MNNFGHYITPEQAKKYHDKLNPDDKLPLKYWKRRAKLKAKCFVCEYEDVWRYGQTGMCFSCTTGEADASDDYELTAGE